MGNEVETAQRAKAKATIAALESKIANLEEQLQGETAERMAQAKINRKAEKKMKENMLMLEDERRHADQYKEQAEKVNSRIKALKRQLDETEEEGSREKAQRRKIQRELEDLMQDNEAKDREITNLKNKLRGMGTLGSSSSSRRRAERERDFLGSFSARGGADLTDSPLSSSLLSLGEAGDSRRGPGGPNSSSPLAHSTEDISLISSNSTRSVSPSGGKRNANASATSGMEQNTTTSSYHHQEHNKS